MMFPGAKEVLWDFKESCHKKSGGETVKQNLSVLGICCVLCTCASAGPSHRPLEILPFQGWRALGGAATCPIPLGGGKCLQCWFFSSEAMKSCAKTRNSHDCFVRLPFCCGKDCFQSYVPETGRNTMICTVFTTQRFLQECLA